MAVSYLMNTNPVRDMHEINHHDDPLIFAQQTSVSASNMIPCFPANNSTDAHHCDIVSNRSSPSHFTKDSPF